MIIQQLVRWIYPGKHLSPVSSVLLSLSISLPWAIYLFPISYILGTGSFFESGDSVQHLSGWLFFRNDSWHFPVLKTVLLEYPKGVNIAYTDSIPLAALFFKSIRFLLPSQFNYFGIWAVFSIVLQGLSSTWVLRLLGERRFIPIVAINFLAITYPALSLRLLMQHTSLYTQGLLILALGVMISGLKGVYSRRKAEWFFRMLMMASLLVHPYFLAMVSALYLGYEGQLISTRIKTLKTTFRDMGTTFSLVILIMALMGYFGSGDPQTGGFGYYSMNLSSLFCGGTILLPGCNIDSTGGQYEGNNYLGLGVIVLGVFAWIYQRGWVLEQIKKYVVLFWTMAGLFLYAIAQDIWLGHLELLSLPFPHFFITYVFRSNGRFFWPVGEALLFIVFLALMKFRNQKVVLGLTMAVVVLQLTDLHGIIQGDRAFARSQDPVFVSRVEKWSPLVQNVSLVRILPPFICGAPPDQALFFQFLSAQNIKPFIGAYVAHGGINQDCSSMTNAHPQNGELDLLLMKEPDKQKLPIGIREELATGQCRQFSHGLACLKGSSSQWWEEHAPWMKIVSGRGGA